VPRGQWEAACALSLSPWRTYASVVLQQAIRPVIPALGNYLVAMFKDTPVVSAITVIELMQQAKNIGSETFRYLEPLTHMHRNGKLVPASPRHLREVRSKIGMVFQSFNLFPHMTALQNTIEAPMRVLGMTRKDAVERAKDLLSLVGLADKCEYYPSQLSGGQQQRVAIARALAMRPKVMLFDEVTSALDPELCGEVLNVIRRLGSEHNLTMLMVTHQMGFAKDFADRVCFFSQGKIIEQGPPQQFFTSPQHERTKQFLRAVREAL